MVDAADRVDAQPFDPEAAERVTGDVEGEQPPVAQRQGAAREDEGEAEREVPQRLVQEGRVVEDAGLAAVLDVDLQPPRQRGRRAVELLVEPVAPAADGLREGDAGRDRVGDRAHGDAALAHGQPDAEGAERDRAPDAEAALPDEQRLDGLLDRARAEVGLPVGDDVVEPAADQAEDDRGDRDVDDRPLLAAAGAPAPLAQPDGDDDAEHDA